MLLAQRIYSLAANNSVKLAKDLVETNSTHSEYFSIPANPSFEYEFETDDTHFRSHI